MSVARSPPWGACGEVCAGQPGAGRAPALGPGGGFWLKARFPVTFYFETIAGMLSSGESGEHLRPRSRGAVLAARARVRARFPAGSRAWPCPWSRSEPSAQAADGSLAPSTFRRVSRGNAALLSGVAIPLPKI